MVRSRRQPRGNFGLYGERTGDREVQIVRREFRALLDDEDEAVGDDAATFVHVLDRIGSGSQPPDEVNRDPEDPDLFHRIEGKACMLYTVLRDTRGRVRQVVALRFCRSASGHVKVEDSRVARERLREMRR